MVVSVSMYRPALFNESLLTHSPFQLLLAAIRASMPSQMTCRLLHENDTALSALYPHRLMGIDIFYFRIVKPVTMYLLCILDKLRCRFPTKRHLGIIVYRMSMYQTILIFQLVSQLLGQTLVFADQKLHKLL